MDIRPPAASGTSLPSQTGNSGKVLSTDGTNPLWAAGGTSVASAVAVTPTGNISSTDVQAALAELDTEKATTAYVDAGDALAVPKSLVDAKGDLLAGTADNTIARLAVGSDGQVLTADSAQTAGVKWAAAAAAGGLTLISSQILGADAATVTFSSIPGTYKTLLVDLIVRTGVASGVDSLLTRFNGDTATNYDTVYAETTNASTLTLATIKANAYMWPGRIAGNTLTAGEAGTMRLLVPEYANTTWRKLLVSAGGYVDPAAQALAVQAVCKWRSTSAITSITFATSSGANILTGSIFRLWGQS